MGFTFSRPAAAAVVVIALLGIPAAYVALHRTHTPAAAAAENLSLAQLEAMEASDPSAANRLNLSRALINAGQQGRAIPLLKPLVSADPKNASAWNNLCVAYTLQMEYNHALPACETGVQLAPSAPIVQNNLKWAQSETAKARQQVSAAASVPDAQRLAPYYLSLGLNHLHLGEYTEAEAAFKRALELQPASAEAQNNIGVAQMMLSHLKEAEDSFRKAVTMDPNLQMARNNLQWALSEEAAAH